MKYNASGHVLLAFFSNGLAICTLKDSTRGTMKKARMIFFMSAMTFIDVLF